MTIQVVGARFQLRDLLTALGVLYGASYHFFVGAYGIGFLMSLLLVQQWLIVAYRDMVSEYRARLSFLMDAMWDLLQEKEARERERK